MKKGEVKAIIFDLGGVIVFYDHMIAARQMSRIINISPKKIFKILNGEEKIKEFANSSDKGISSRKYWSDSFKGLKIKVPYRKFDKIWTTIFFPNKGIKSIISKLKKEYRVALLSNTNFNHKNYLLKNYNLKNLFSILIFSCDVKIRKPQSKIFKLALKKLKVLPKEAVFIDDKIENVKGAKKAGFHGIHFKNNKHLLKELEKLGVKLK